MGLWNTVKSKMLSLNYFQVKKQLKIATDALLRPFSGDYRYQSIHIYPIFPYQTNVIYDLAYNSDTLTSIHNSLRRELFRNGFDLIEAVKTDETITTSEEEVMPKGKTKEEILTLLEEVNENGQSVIDVLMELEDDFSIMDDGFLIFIFDYYMKKNGDIEKKELSQILRGDPRFMGLIQNKYDRPGFDDDGTELLVCPQHRDNLLRDHHTCPECSCKTFRVHFFTDWGGQKVYYFKNEIVFRSKYRPGKRRGFPPVITVWQKTRTLLFMDKYIMELYDGQRPPKHGLFFKTSNQAALEKSLLEAKQRVQEDPHWPLTMAVPDTSNGRQFVEFIDFMKGLDELQHTEMRNEYRRQIGAVYGVEPIFQGDQSNSGGLNNEGLQITVTNRAVEYGQAIYNKYFLPKILEAMGVEGWHLRLNPSEEQDEMAKLQRQSQALANGEQALRLGLVAEYDDDTGEVVVNSGELELEVLESVSDGFDQPGVIPNKPRTEGAPLAKKGPPFTKISETIKREIDKFITRFKKRPSEAELSKAISKINLKLQQEIQQSTKGLFSSLYKNEMEKVGKEIGVNVLFGTTDQNALNALLNQDVLSKAFLGLSTNIVGKLNDVITDAYRDPKGLSTKQITDKIKDIVDVSDSRAENIARTETSKVSSAARKISYQKEEDFDNFIFKWIGPSDNRTTNTSKRIKSRTRNGVSFTELVKIVEEESAKDFPGWTVDKNAPVSHYNSRHSFLRIG